MSEILEHIHEDHRNMAVLLNILESELEDLKSGNDHDYSLMAHIIDYFNHYPNKFHHPFEDKVFAWIAQERPQLSSLVEDLRAEHESREQVGRDIAILLKAIQSDHMVPRDKLANELDAYITAERDHINREEGELLKEVEGVLGGLRLSEIPIPDRSELDPLFGATTKSKYAELAHAINEQRESSETSASRADLN